MTPALSQALTERGYDTLTPVQEAVSDPDLAGSDLLVSAQTGSGKTVGFGLAIAPTLLGEADRFGPAGAPLALVVAPTRELAFQVMRELEWLYAKTGARVTSCVGGMDMRDERRALDRGAHIVVGTPGRLRDHIERRSLDMSDLRAVILDEADEMLDLGFREDLEFMLGKAPEDRRTLLFSATVPPTIATLAQQYQRDAKRINTVGSAKQHTDIAYQAVRVAQQDSENAIFNLLRYHDAESAIVFCNTRAAVNHLMARLTNRGFDVVALSGELTQSERTNALQAMRDGRARVCVATDVAARGIDLPNLNLVIHADLPTNTESLLHRSGRTGRAGRKGISALIVPPKATKKMERILKWAKITAEWTTAPSADDIRRLDEERLLNDPAWDAPATEDETGFAAKLLDRHPAEAIAAAYLRLYRARRSAPEELLPPDTRAPAREHQSFGPSSWVSLSVGRNDRAEPRWLLPMLCRAGNIDKTAIGAIRVQDTETYVELTTASLPGFLKALGPDGTLEDGVTAQVLEGAPDMPPPGRRPPRAEPRPERVPASGADADREADRKPRKPRHDDARPQRAAPHAAANPMPGPDAASAMPADAPLANPLPAPDAWKPKRKATEGGKPHGAKGKPPAKSHVKPRDGSDARSDGPKSRDATKDPARGSGPSRDKATGKGAGKWAGKPTGKPAGKPTGKPSAKPASKPRSAPSDARDTSQRFTPPGKAPSGPRKPGKPGKPARDAGNKPPQRGKP